MNQTRILKTLSNKIPIQILNCINKYINECIFYARIRKTKIYVDFITTAHEVYTYPTDAKFHLKPTSYATEKDEIINKFIDLLNETYQLNIIDPELLEKIIKNLQTWLDNCEDKYKFFDIVYILEKEGYDGYFDDFEIKLEELINKTIKYPTIALEFKQ